MDYKHAKPDSLRSAVGIRIRFTVELSHSYYEWNESKISELWYTLTKL